MNRSFFHWNSILRFFLRLILGSLFLYAAFSKWNWMDVSSGPQEFAQSVANFRMDTLSIAGSHISLLPPSLVPFFSVAVLGAEVLLGIFLLLGIWEKETVFLTSLLLLMFGIATTSILVRGIQIDCGCFGKGPSPATWTTLFWKDLLPLCLALGLLVLMKFKPQDLASSRAHDNNGRWSQ